MGSPPARGFGVHAGLELLGCGFSATALPLLRNPMLQLRTLTVELDHSDDMDAADLESLLLLLCRPHSFAAPLQRLTVTGCCEDIDTQDCEDSVQEQLQVDFGVSGVLLDVG